MTNRIDARDLTRQAKSERSWPVPQKLLHWDADKIEQGLYLGSLTAARNEDKLRELGITHILTVMNQQTYAVQDCKHKKQLDTISVGALSFKIPGALSFKTSGTVLFKTVRFGRKQVNVQDMPSADLQPFFRPCSEWISKAQSKDGSVLVHCRAGVSRSSSIVCAHLMLSRSWPLDKALAHLRLCRPCVMPNAGFLKQLKALERQIFGKPARITELSHVLKSAMGPTWRFSTLVLIQLVVTYLL